MPLACDCFNFIVTSYGQKQYVPAAAAGYLPGKCRYLTLSNSMPGMFRVRFDPDQEFHHNKCLQGFVVVDILIYNV